MMEGPRDEAGQVVEVDEARYEGARQNCSHEALFHGREIPMRGTIDHADSHSHFAVRSGSLRRRLGQLKEQLVVNCQSPGGSGPKTTMQRMPCL